MRDIQIYRDNQILLTKMMSIEKKESDLNSRRLVESRFAQDSLGASYKKFASKRILNENQVTYLLIVYFYF